MEQRLGAAVAGMALTHTIARGVIKGLLTNNAPFFRTPKAEDKPALMQGLAMAAEELTILGLLWGGCLAVLIAYGADNTEALVITSYSIHYTKLYEFYRIIKTFKNLRFIPVLLQYRSSRVRLTRPESA